MIVGSCGKKEDEFDLFGFEYKCKLSRKPKIGQKFIILNFSLRKATLISQARNLNRDYGRDGAFNIYRIFYDKCGLVQEAGVLSASLAYLWKFSNNIESIFNSLGGKQ